MATPTTKGEQVRVFLQPREIETLDQLVTKTEIGKTDLCSRLLSAALRCVQENDFRITLPLHFRYAESPVSEEKPLQNRASRATR